MSDYFKHDELAYDVWRSKYQQNEETVEQFFSRLSDNFYREFKHHDSLSKYGKERLNEPYNKTLKTLFEDFKYVIPGGSVLAGIGTDKPVSLSNCYVVGTKDSVSEIFDTAKQMANIYKRRGGVGTDMSELRPRGALVNNASNTTTGVVPFMELFSQTTNTIGQEGRRGALMISLDIRHPDSPEFAISKRDLTKITGANISLKVSKDFMDAVEQDEDYILKWPIYIDFEFDSGIRREDLQYNKLQKGALGYYKKIKAKELWDTIIESNWKSAEPGILFWDNVIDYDPASVYPEYRAISTNPCQPSWATVLTPEGIKTFKDINIGDRIWSSEGWSKIINKQSSGIQDVYKYQTTRGMFIGTKEHKIVEKGVKVEVQKAESIDTLKYSEEFKPIIDNQDVMDGLVIGDGSVHKASNNLIFLCIGENDQDYFDSEVADYIIEHREKLKPTAYTIKTTITSEELPLLPVREIPERFVFGNKDKVCGFLRGLYTANGSVVDKRVTLKTSSTKLRDQVQIMLSSLGISSYFTTNKTKKVQFNNGEYECKESYDINIGPDRKKFYDLIGFVQKYKTEKLENIINTKNSGRKEVAKVISEEFISTEEVFDITVDNKTHTYWTGGLNVSNCGEIPLGAYDACRLIAVNVYNLVTNPFSSQAYLNEDIAYKVFYEAQVIADTLVDIELMHIERIIELGDEQELWKKVYEIGKNGRRTGTGITALGDMCAALGVSYGDPETVEKLMSLKLKAELDASIDLAVVEGAFPVWDRSKEFEELSFIDLEGKNDWYKFIAQNYPDQAFRMSIYGRRNISLSTIAPTGSLSILAGTSSGCEPVFSLYYMRRKKCNSGETPDFIDQNGVGFKNYMVIHPKFLEWYKVKFGEELTDISEENLNRLYEISPWFNQTANDLTPLQRIETQSILQKYTTHSISSTVNLPEDVPMDTVDELYKLGYKMNLKGLTTYRAGSRSGILVNANEKVVSKERPDELPCKVLRFKNEKKGWIAFVGIKDDRPYEIFTGINDLDEFPIPSYIEEGVIIKVPGENRSRYDFRYVDSYGYTNTLGGLNRIFNKEYWNYARFVSALLREGTPLQSIVNIIEKLEFSNKTLNNWQFGIVRCLKSFITDGTKSEEACPECGEHTIVYENGCKTCKSCGDSKCN